MRRRMDRALDLIHAADGPVYVKKLPNHVGPGPYPCLAAWIGRWTLSMGRWTRICQKMIKSCKSRPLSMRRRMDRTLDLILAADGPVYAK